MTYRKNTLTKAQNVEAFTHNIKVRFYRFDKKTREGWNELMQAADHAQDIKIIFNHDPQKWGTWRKEHKMTDGQMKLLSYACNIRGYHRPAKSDKFPLTAEQRKYENIMEWLEANKPKYFRSVETSWKAYKAAMAIVNGKPENASKSATTTTVNKDKGTVTTTDENGKVTETKVKVATPAKKPEASGQMTYKEITNIMRYYAQSFDSLKGSEDDLKKLIQTAHDLKSYAQRKLNADFVKQAVNG